MLPPEVGYSKVELQDEGRYDQRSTSVPTFCAPANLQMPLHRWWNVPTLTLPSGSSVIPRSDSECAGTQGCCTANQLLTARTISCLAILKPPITIGLYARFLGVYCIAEWSYNQHIAYNGTSSAALRYSYLVPHFSGSTYHQLHMWLEVIFQALTNSYVRHHLVVDDPCINCLWLSALHAYSLEVPSLDGLRERYLYKNIIVKNPSSQCS